jgi:hypothetical protein
MEILCLTLAFIAVFYFYKNNTEFCKSAAKCIIAIVGLVAFIGGMYYLSDQSEKQAKLDAYNAYYNEMICEVSPEEVKYNVPRKSSHINYLSCENFERQKQERERERQLKIQKQNCHN